MSPRATVWSSWAHTVASGHPGIHDRPGRRPHPAARSKESLPELARVWADGGYTGHLTDWTTQDLGLVLDIVRRSDDAAGFEILPRRWVVERSFAWLLRSRRLVRDYERRTDTSETVTLWSMTMLMSRRLAAQHQQRPTPARAA